MVIDCFFFKDLIGDEDLDLNLGDDVCIDFVGDDGGVNFIDDGEGGGNCEFIFNCVNGLDKMGGGAGVVNLSFEYLLTGDLDLDLIPPPGNTLTPFSKSESVLTFGSII